MSGEDTSDSNGAPDSTPTAHIEPPPQSPPSPQPNDAGRVATWFVIKLMVLTLLVGLGEGYFHQTDSGVWLQDGVASVSTWLVRLFDASIVRKENQIISHGPILMVTLQCTAVFAMGLFCSAVIAFPCGWRARLLGVAIGLLGVAVINIVRISGLVLIAQHRPSFFHFAHLVLMQGFLISCVAPMWLLWAAWTTKRMKAPRG